MFEEVGGDAIEFFGDPTDAEALALKIKSLIDDPIKRLQMSETGIAEAKKYSAANVVGNYLEIYESLHRP